MAATAVARRDTITWIRRTRVLSAWADGTNVPLGGAAERYEIDIRNATNTATLRTIAVTSPVATYTAAEQTADSGMTQTAVAIATVHRPVR
ncbi:hypothetical protein [Falsiroseomonas sp.]|uniref:hypothetical protein n=1 Tax=Falsiroseomonas sp. TaxID=2870721 RepID=UPI00356699C7